MLNPRQPTTQPPAQQASRLAGAAGPGASGEAGAPSALPTFQDVLAAYAPGDCLFVSPGGSWLGQGQAAAASTAFDEPEATHAAAAQRLRAQVAALLAPASAAPALVMGAVPFDTRLAARLIRPQRVLRGAGIARAAAGDLRPTTQAGRSPVAPLSVQPQPPAETYADAVRQALAHFQSGQLDKVVLARTLRVELPQAPDGRALLQRLAALNAHGYTYAVPLEGDAAQGAHAFLGATPELLVRRVGRQVIVNPLAGSAARSQVPHEDGAIGQALMQSAKDRHEHAVVIDAVARALRPLCRALEVPPQPSLVRTDALWHLSTTLVGELADPATTSLDLALALHPTPAVCGHPTDRAFEAIAALEPFERGLFAGFVGWCDASGDGEWAVSLRCAELRGRTVRLYAGAGIVAGSDPAAEVAETQTKFRTMLRALGLE